ncbi:Crp/Fnr family transcriptional regulator, partial [Vibrio sp.]|nr:Crp/Fnr family transcriptional regulator [Vibrio sp.]
MLLTRYIFTNEFTPYEQLFKISPHETCHFKKGDFLCDLGKPFTKIFYIVDGLTKVSVMHKNGEEKITGFWGKGGIYPLICTEHNFVLEYSIMQVAISDVTAFAFDVDVIRNMMHESTELCQEMVNHYCKFTNLLFFCATTQTYEPV